jgi:membrane-associated phospholipid phosphatase
MPVDSLSISTAASRHAHALKPCVWGAAALVTIAAGFAGLDRWFYESVATQLNTPDPIDRDFYHLTLPLWDAVRFFPHIIGVSVCLLIILWFRPHGRRRAILAALVILVAAFSANLAQQLIGRIRPNLANSAWAFLPPGAGLMHHAPVGFPSGEVATAFALAFVLRRQFRRRAGIAIVLAALVALARVLFGMHYISDVACGALFGWTAAAAATRLLLGAWLRLGRRRRQRTSRTQNEPSSLRHEPASAN